MLTFSKKGGLNPKTTDVSFIFSFEGFPLAPMLRETGKQGELEERWRWQLEVELEVRLGGGEREREFVVELVSTGKTQNMI